MSGRSSHEPLIYAFATKGSGTNEEDRLRDLLSGHRAEFLPYDKAVKRQSAIQTFRRVLADRPDLLVVEGTGLGGGLVCLLSRLLIGQAYVVSSGDAVGPFVGSISSVFRPAFAVYERLLCRLSRGFIGWTPYLVGRALTFGAPRGMTAAGWGGVVPDAEARLRVRRSLGIPDDMIVFGIAGSVVWNSRFSYCYGAELVGAIRQVERKDVGVLIVGGGTGLDQLREMAGNRVGRSIWFTGPLPGDRVAENLAAMDVGSLPQSVDGVGAFRYTTKISEYLAAKLPVVTSQIPLAYDLDGGWLWRLPGESPWSIGYVEALADLMRRVTPDAISDKRATMAHSEITGIFDRDRQVRAVTSFIAELLNELPVKQRQIPRSIARSQPSENMTPSASDQLNQVKPAKN